MKKSTQGGDHEREKGSIFIESCRYGDVLILYHIIDLPPSNATLFDSP